MIDEGREAVGVHDVPCYGEELVGGEGVDFGKSLFEALDVVCVEVLLGGAQRHVLGVVGSYAELSFQLSFGSSEGARGEGCIGEAAELLGDKAQTTLHVGVVAAEIDAPDTRVGVSGIVGFYGVDESCALAQGEAEAGVHGRAAQDIRE